MALTKDALVAAALLLSLGVLCLAAFWIGDDPRSGLYALALMAPLGCSSSPADASTWFAACAETAETSTGSGSTCTRATSQDSSRSASRRPRAARAR